MLKMDGATWQLRCLFVSSGVYGCGCGIPWATQRPWFLGNSKKISGEGHDIYVSIYYVSKNTIPDAQCITYLPTFG